MTDKENWQDKDKEGTEKWFPEKSRNEDDKKDKDKEKKGPKKGLETPEERRR